MDFIPLAQQQFGQIGAVLASDAGDECFFHTFAVFNGSKF